MRRLIKNVALVQNSVQLCRMNIYQTQRFIHLTSSLLNTSPGASTNGFVIPPNLTSTSTADEADDDHEENISDVSEESEEEWMDPANPPHYREKKIDKYGQAHGVGRRKTASARVWIKPGVGQVKVNHKDVAEYFQNSARIHALEPFQVTQTAGCFDVWCLVRGGGIMGQAGAVRLGLARALEAYEPSLKPLMKREKLLTRDSRMVERKKPGLKKARKAKQWVKR